MEYQLSLKQEGYSEEDINAIADKLGISIEEAGKIWDHHIEPTILDMFKWLFEDVRTNTTLLEELNNANVVDPNTNLLENLLYSYNNIVKISEGYIYIY